MKSDARTRPQEVYNTEERRKILLQMHHISDLFYSAATAARCHPFIEFTGLMNEYLACCESAHRNGVDFTQCNTHAGQALPMQAFNAAYLAEKLNCIYGPSLLSDDAIRDAFIATLFEGKFKLVPA